MTETSYNGWNALPTTAGTIVMRPLGKNGPAFRIVDNRNVRTIFRYLVRAYNAHVEPLSAKQGDNWGWAYREDRNNPTSLSCHASGTALDFRATLHPNDTSWEHSFTDKQYRQIIAILTYLDGTVTWGGNPGGLYGWHAGDTSDPMHWEIRTKPGSLVKVARKIRRQAKKAAISGNPEDEFGHIVVPHLGRPQASIFDIFHHQDIRPFVQPDPNLPATFSWPQVTTDAVGGTPWGMMLNDRLGDCTCAAVGHAVMLTSAISATTPDTISDDDVLALYEAVAGYDPATGANDNGAVETDVLKRWHDNGINTENVGPVAIESSGWVGPFSDQSPEELIAATKTAITKFGFAYVGTQVPQAWEAAPAVWDVPTPNTPDAQVVGGHAVILIGWDATGFQLVSWGKVYTVTYAAFSRYFDEVHGAVVAGCDIPSLPAAERSAMVRGMKREPQIAAATPVPALALGARETPRPVVAAHGAPVGDDPAPTPAPAPIPVVTQDEVDKVVNEIEQFTEGLIYKIASPVWRKVGLDALAGLVAGVVALVSMKYGGHGWGASFETFGVVAVAAFVVKLIPSTLGLSQSQIEAIEEAILAYLSKAQPAPEAKRKAKVLLAAQPEQVKVALEKARQDTVAMEGHGQRPQV